VYTKPDGSIPIVISNNPPAANSTAASRGYNFVKSWPGHFHLILRVYGA
jgi:hypothetical protein